MILIPLPSSAGNHQFHNASSFAKKNAAIMIQENELSNNIIENKILELLNNKIELENLANNANNFIVKNALDKIVYHIKELDELEC